MTEPRAAKGTVSDVGRTEELDVAIVGAGVAGLYSVYKLRGLGLRVRAFEQGPDLGGTWYWNKYPGARCDVPSWDYSFSFSPELEQEWHWTERYATQPEILAYLNHTADRFKLRESIEFGVCVEHVHYDSDSARWRLSMDDGRAVVARYVVAASGILSTVNVPDIKGLDDFGGLVVHTGRWPQNGLDVSGLRVGLIGTGSSGSQVAPWLAENADELYVFQRRPVYAVPAHHRAISDEEAAEVKRTYRERRATAKYSPTGAPYPATDRCGTEVDDETFREVAEKAWAEGGIFAVQTCFADIATSPETNERLSEFVRQKIAAKVEDPATAEALVPVDYPLGAKRLVVEEGYYEVYNRSNVHLVSIKDTPIDHVSSAGIVVDGTTYDLDVIVFATGFDAVSGSIFRMDVRGRDGRPMTDAWADGPTSYLGLSVPDFPNFFLVAGPGSPSAFSNLIDGIEHSLDYTTDLIEFAEKHNAPFIEAEPAATESWMDQVDMIAKATVYADTDGWYNGTNIDGKARRWTAFLGGVGYYRETLDDIAAKGYPGYRFGVEVEAPSTARSDADSQRVGVN